MTKKKPIEAYADCLRVLDLAIAHNGIRLPFDNINSAIRERHRLYRARVTYVEAVGNPQYNDIYIQLVQDGKIIAPKVPYVKGKPAELILRLHSVKPLLEMTDLQGNPITPTEAETSDLLDAVAAVTGRLALE